MPWAEPSVKDQKLLFVADRRLQPLPPGGSGDRTSHPRRCRPRWTDCSPNTACPPRSAAITVRPSPSTGAGGLTRLSARWAKMGIRLERIWPGKPQQNGRHERMHGTLKPEACQPPSATAARQQDRFDAFRREFNHERPHEALGQRQPAEFYRPSPRPFVEPVDDLDYGPHEQSDACVRGRDQVARLHALRVRGDQGRDRWRRPTSRRPLAHPLRRRCLGPHRSQLGSTCPLWCGAAAPHQSGHTSLVECRILSGM